MNVAPISMGFVLSYSGIAFKTFKLLCIRSVKTATIKIIRMINSQNKHELILKINFINEDRLAI